MGSERFPLPDMLITDIEVDVSVVDSRLHLMGRFPVNAGEVTGVAEMPLRFFYSEVFQHFMPLTIPSMSFLISAWWNRASRKECHDIT